MIYLDAMIVKVKDGGHTRNKAAHIAVGVDMAGVKHVLGIWVQQNEERRSGRRYALIWPTEGYATC